MTEDVFGDAIALELAAHLNADVNFTLNYRALEKDIARPGSPAHMEIRDTDLDGPEPAESVRAAYQPAGLLLTAGTHLLGCIAQLMQPPIGILGYQIIERSVLEVSARAWWLLEPDLGGRKRVSRAWTEQLFAAQESVKAAFALTGQHDLSENRLVESA
jgi:hypothetical protein